MTYLEKVAGIGSVAGDAIRKARQLAGKNKGFGTNKDKLRSSFKDPSVATKGNRSFIKGKSTGKTTAGINKKINDRVPKKPLGAEAKPVTMLDKVKRMVPTQAKNRASANRVANNRRSYADSFDQKTPKTANPRSFASKMNGIKGGVDGKKRFGARNRADVAERVAGAANQKQVSVLGQKAKMNAAKNPSKLNRFLAKDVF